MSRHLRADHGFRDRGILEGTAIWLRSDRAGRIDTRRRALRTWSTTPFDRRFTDARIAAPQEASGAGRPNAGVGRFLFELAAVTGLGARRLCAAALFAIVAGCGVEPPHNVVLISIDSLRADHVHSCGYPRQTSPSIDRLAAEGILFTTVVAPSSWTLPSHATLLTGLPPVAHGVVRVENSLGPGVLTLAEVFLQSGYETAGFVSGPFMSQVFGLHQGFETYDERLALVEREESHRIVTSPQLFESVTGWLRAWSEGSGGRPFFLFVHAWDVHYDYNPPAPYDDHFGPEYTRDFDFSDLEHNPAIHPGMAREDLDRLIALYDGEIRFTDRYIGELMATIDDLGLADSTVVAVTADHGEEFFEHGRKGHRKNLFDEVLLVPLVLRGPGVSPPGTRIETQARLMDVPSTLLSLAGVRIPDGFAAQDHAGTLLTVDLSRLFSNRSRGWDPPPAYADLHGGLGAVRHDGFKYIGTIDGTSEEHLYELESDPGERTNLVGDRIGRAAELRQALFQWRGRVTAVRHIPKDADLSPEMIEHLRALGYVD